MFTRFILPAALAFSFAAASAQAAAGHPEKTRQCLAVLQSNAPFYDQARACQQLGEIGTSEAVPALAKLLADDRLAAYARSGLEGIGDPAAAAALREALGRVRGAQLAGVINSLGVLRDPAATEALIQLAAEEGPGLGKEAWLALGRIATPPAVQVLQQALAGAPEARRPEAAAACLLAAEKLLADGQAETAAALYDAVRNAPVPASFRAGAVRGAILARPAGGVPLLLEQLHSADRVLRHAALTTIREAPSEALANALHQEIAQAGPELRPQLVKALEDCHNPQSFAVLEGLLSDPDAEIRRLALAVLGKIGGAAQAGALLQVLAEERSAQETSLALAGLERMPGSEVEAAIVQALAAAANPGARLRLIRLVEGRGMAASNGMLLQLAAGADAPAAVAALRALKSLARPGDLPALLALARASRSEDLRDAAENAVVGAIGRSGQPGIGGEAVLAEFQQAAAPAEKNSWIRILVSLGHPNALPAIQAALGSADESVAATTAEQLGRWPDPAPIEALLNLAETGAQAGLRQRALRSAIQLATAAAEEGQRPGGTVADWFQRAAKAGQTAADSRAIISGLGHLKHPASLRQLIPSLEQPELAAEAAVAILQVAPALARQAEAAALLPAALEKIAATAKSPEIRAQAVKIKNAMGKNKP
jgi:HEAT repeat protein